ncbi:MAG TPA: glycosyltransferase family 39 protein [Solirubrobacteraceae bacterium]|nr:glycosyltransferase family 39 protein [Solirubrobacteraceae bacterium]
MTEETALAPSDAQRQTRWHARRAAGIRSGERVTAQRWVRPALIALLLVTAGAYAWNLNASGYANEFYAAAVQAGTESWKAFFFGALDSSSFITVDKPPASLWLMALSGRIFGFSSWSMLLPNALAGVAAVWLLYGAIKRWFGAPAGLLAGAMLAMTPVAALMFRFNNPDSLLVALLVASAYCLTRAIERANTRWILATGALIGFAFLAKLGQAFLVLPAFAAAYLLAAPTSLRRRLAQLCYGLAAIIVAAGWWVTIVALLPAGSRPFIDGSPDNNIFNLIFNYDGFSRIFGSGGPGGGAGGGAMFSGPTGVLRLFNDLLGGQASWLLPASLVALVLGLWLRRRAPRVDRTRAALIVWGGWLLVTAAIFSFSTGVIHTYYTVALAPAIAALVAIGGVLLWEQRDAMWARIVAALTVSGSGAWAYVLLERTPSWEPWLRPLVLVAAILGAGGLLTAPLLGRFTRNTAILTAMCVAVGCFAGPLAYAAQTVTSAHKGSLPSAGPTASGSAGRIGGGAAFASGGAAGRPGSFPGGGLPRDAGSRRGFPGAPASSGSSPASSLFGSGARQFSGLGGAGIGGAGQATIGRALAKLLERDSRRYRWIAATSGSNSAALIELATGGEAVMAIGGFNGNGGDLTLPQFERYVDKGEIHYYVDTGGGFGGFGGRSASSTSEISSWVASHFTAKTIDGATVYVL